MGTNSQCRCRAKRRGNKYHGHLSVCQSFVPKPRFFVSASLTSLVPMACDFFDWLDRVGKASYVLQPQDRAPLCRATEMVQAPYGSSLSGESRHSSTHTHIVG